LKKIPRIAPISESKPINDTHNNIDTSSVKPRTHGTNLMSLKYSCSTALLAVILLVGSKQSMLWNTKDIHIQYSQHQRNLMEIADILKNTSVYKF